MRPFDHSTVISADRHAAATNARALLDTARIGELDASRSRSRTVGDRDEIADACVLPCGSMLVRTLVELADTLVDGFDVVELLTMLADRCVELLDIAAAGVVLVAEEQGLRVMASDAAVQVVGLFELQSDEGPSVECYRSGTPVVNQDLAAAAVRWPRLATLALGSGYRSVHAVPLCVRGTVIGALTLFRDDLGTLDGSDVVAAQALADVAAIAILQHHAGLESAVLITQLNGALASRIVIEQAKGVISEHAVLDMDDAYAVLRTYARNNNAKLADVAQRIAHRTMTVEALTVTSRANGVNPAR